MINKIVLVGKDPIFMLTERNRNKYEVRRNSTGLSFILFSQFRTRTHSGHVRFRLHSGTQ